MNKILLFIPAHNEQDTIRKVIDDYRNVLSQDLNKKCDVLVVDDGSKDKTVAESEDAGAVVISHNKNLGLGRAFQSGVSYAIENKYEIMLTVDADGQFASSDVESLLNPILTKEADMVTGSRFLPESKLDGIPAAKRWGNYVMSYLISSLIKNKFADVSCGFRAYNREVLLRLNLFGAFTYTHEVILNLADKGVVIKEVPISVKYYPKRVSRIANSLIKYAWRTIVIIFGSTIAYRPLRLFGTITGFLWAIGIPVVFVLGTRYILVGIITPFKGIAITALVLCVAGAISLSAGIILDVARRIQVTQERILYLARKEKYEQH